MPAPFTTPVAFSTPFESEPERSNGFISKNVQEAIEEALALAISNDRYLVLAQYNGNANTGRLLEFYAGIDSDDAPLHFNGNTIVTSIICSTVGTSSNATIGFYDKLNDPGLATPLYTLDMNGQKFVEITVPTTTPLFSIPSDGELLIKVDSNSIQKPHMQVIFSSQA